MRFRPWRDSMWRPALALALLCGCAVGQIQDATRQPGTAGPQVVEAVINLIRESCVFPNNRLLLRRFAFMVTNDGQNAGTYRPGFDGGIWAVSESAFRGTQNDARLAAYYQDIVSRFGIAWNSLQWSDLRKPLFSGLAAALYMVQTFGDNVPVGVERQAAWYQQAFYPNDPMAAYNFTKQANNAFSGCSISNLDLAFLVDSSASLSPLDFQQALTFASDVIESFTVGPQELQVAFLTFSTGFKTVFDFNDYSSVAAVQAAIRGAQYRPGETDTDQALGYAASTLFLPGGPAGARPASAKLAVIVTDGKATRSADALRKAQELRQKGVTVFVIGVGDEVDKQELNNLATQPNCTHVQVLKDYQDLDSLRSEIQRLSCRAPFILKEGNYTFPCDTTSNFRIAINVNETITIKPADGFVDIYGSFLNPYPNTAFNEFKTRATSGATSGRAAIIYVKDESRPLYLSIVSKGGDPVFCRKGNNYQVTVQNKNAIQPALGFPNPCRPNHPGYFPHPLSYTRFVYCDNQGVAYLVLCPAHYWYNDNAQGCVPGTPPTVTLPTLPATTHRPQVTNSLPPLITNLPGTNPCTQEALNRGDRFFPYPSDPHKYIACTEWPNYGVIKDCAPYHKWSQHDLACIYRHTVVDPTKDIYVSTPAALSVDCKVGLNDLDLFYHPYPGDNTKFIQCDQFGDAFVMSCPPGRVWNQHFLTCAPDGLLPSGNTPIG
ncbi:hypothetical protein ACOMHN_066073 [Nucella lapillus]